MPGLTYQAHVGRFLTQTYHMTSEHLESNYFYYVLVSFFWILNISSFVFHVNKKIK